MKKYPIFNPPAIAFLAVALIILNIAVKAQTAPDIKVDPTFVSQLAGGQARAVALQADGKFIVAGTFTSFASEARIGVVRMNADGTIDRAFTPNANNSVQAVAVQTDGKIVIGGDFTQVGGQPQARLARLNADGALDTTFANPAIDATVYTVAVQADGKIIAGGSFAVAGGQARKEVARFNTNGSLDTALANPALSGVSTVYALAVQADGKILVGGDVFVGTSSSYFGRLNADGTYDTSFPSYVSSRVQAIKIQADGKILVGGSFAFVKLPDGTSINRKSLVRFNSNGTLDLSFNDPTIESSYVYSIALSPDGKIIIGTSVLFSNSIGGQPRNNIARLFSDGSLDTTYNPNINGLIPSSYALALQTDGKLIVGGYFETVGGQRRINLVRLAVDGSPEVFPKDISLDSTVSRIILQPDGKILVSGAFTSAGGRTRKQIVRLNSDSSLDPSFVNSNIVTTYPTLGRIYGIALQTDGKILVGGDITSVNGIARTAVIRLNADGTLDNAFNPNVTNGSSAGDLNTVAVQADGKILIGGHFDKVNGQDRFRLARLNADGSLDASFVFDQISDTSAIVPLANGQVLVGGGGIYRLNANGSTDASFQNSVGSVSTIFFQPNGKILVGGGFYNAGGQPRRSLARLNADGSLDTSFQDPNILGSVYEFALQADGRILIGGDFYQVAGQDRRYMARINGDGTFDPTFTPIFDDGFSGNVYAVKIQTDGKILIGGDFRKVNGLTQPYISRLNGSFTATNPCAPVAVNFGQTVNGNLGAAGCLGVARAPEDLENGAVSNPNKAADRNSAENLVRYADYYSFAATAGQQIAVSMSSGAFDTYLFLLNASGAVIAENDDIDTSNTNSRIPISGFFTIPATGVYTIRATSYAENATGAYTLNLSLNTVVPTARRAFDFDGDGKADVSVFRPSNGAWYLLQSSSGFTGIQFGVAADKIVPADYDGDGKTDVAVYRSGVWYLNRSQLGFTAISFGTADDIPVPADYDGDGKADLAVFRPSNGVWYLLRSQLGFTSVQFGQNGDKPVAGDYDGDGKADLAVYRSGIWYLLRSQLGFTGIGFGTADDKPVPADYDGDGKTDVAVFRPSNGTWYLLQSTAGFTGIAFGAGTDIPVPADYDGDGKTDVAVFRSGIWYLNRSTAGFTGIAFGASDDRPTPAAFVR